MECKLQVLSKILKLKIKFSFVLIKRFVKNPFFEKLPAVCPICISNDVIQVPLILSHHSIKKYIKLNIHMPYIRKKYGKWETILYNTSFVIGLWLM